MRRHCRVTFAIAERSGILRRLRGDEEPANAGAGSRSAARSTLVRAAGAVLISPLNTRTIFRLVGRASILFRPTVDLAVLLGATAIGAVVAGLVALAISLLVFFLVPHKRLVPARVIVVKPRVEVV